MAATARPLLHRLSFALGGQLEPAYAVHGDSFDWSATARSLTLTLVNGTGHRVDAAMVTHLAVNAMRNARRAGVPLTAQAELTDQTCTATTTDANTSPRCCCSWTC